MTGARAHVPNGGSMIGANARLDPQSGNVFMLPSQGSRLASYSPSTNTWRTGWGQFYVRVHATLAIDPQRRWAILLGSGTDNAQITRWSLDTRGLPVDLRPLTTGDQAIERAYGPGFDFHPPSGNFYAWAGGKSGLHSRPGYVALGAAHRTRDKPGPRPAEWPRHLRALPLRAGPQPIRRGESSIDRNVWVYRPL